MLIWTIKITTSKEGLGSGVTERFILLQLARNKGGGTPSGLAQFYIKLRKVSTRLRKEDTLLIKKDYF